MGRRKDIPRKNSQAVVKEKNMHYVLRTPYCKEAMKLQNTTKLVIPKANIYRLIVEILMDRTNGRRFRVQRLALEALHEASEIYLVNRLGDAHILARHAKRATVRPEDLKLGLDFYNNSQR